MNSEILIANAYLLAESFSYKVCLLKSLTTQMRKMLERVEGVGGSVLEIERELSKLDNLLVDAVTAIDEAALALGSDWIENPLATNLALGQKRR